MTGRARTVLRPPARAVATSVFGGLVGVAAVLLGLDVDVPLLVVGGAVMALMQIPTLWPRVVVTSSSVQVRNVRTTHVLAGQIRAVDVVQIAAWPPADRHRLTLSLTNGADQPCWAVQASERTLTSRLLHRSLEELEHDAARVRMLLGLTDGVDDSAGT